ncbi:hypothetical protein [Microbacterium sp. NPDC055683]
MCCTHAALLIAHGWHAVAGAWVVNEKGTVLDAERLLLETHGFSAAATAALASGGAAPEELLAMIAAVRALPRPLA